MFVSMNQALSLTAISIALATLVACAEPVTQPDTSKAAAKPAVQAPIADISKNAQGKEVDNDALRMGKGCPAVGAIKSPGSKNPTRKVTFINQIKAERAATLYWLNPDGEPVETEIFDDKGQAVIDTNDDQSYIAKDFDGTCYGGVYTIKKGQTQVIVSEGAAKAPAAPAVERIQFAKGASSTTVTGNLGSFKDEKHYTITVGKGQTMTVEQLDKQSDGKVSITITDPKGENANDMDLSCHSNATVKPTLAGDYKIQVVECKKADPWKGKYSFSVKVK
jgi:hypothetical protein